MWVNTRDLALFSLPCKSPSTVSQACLEGVQLGREKGASLPCPKGLLGLSLPFTVTHPSEGHEPFRGGGKPECPDSLAP